MKFKLFIHENVHGLSLVFEYGRNFVRSGSEMTTDTLKRQPMTLKLTQNDWQFRKDDVELLPRTVIKIMSSLVQTEE